MNFGTIRSLLEERPLNLTEILSQDKDSWSIQEISYFYAKVLERSEQTENLPEVCMSDFMACSYLLPKLYLNRFVLNFLGRFEFKDSYLFLDLPAALILDNTLDSGVTYFDNLEYENYPPEDLGDVYTVEPEGHRFCISERRKIGSVWHRYCSIYWEDNSVLRFSGKWAQ